MVAAAPRARVGGTLFGRLVQTAPPRRLASGTKLRLRSSIGLLIALSFMNSRSSVLRADSRVVVLLMVTRTVLPGLRSMGMVVPRVFPGVIRHRGKGGGV